MSGAAPTPLLQSSLAHGDALGEHMGLGPAPSVRIRLLDRGFFAATRLTFLQRNFGRTPALPFEDAFIVSLQFRATQPSEVWFEGRSVRSKPAGANSMAIFNLNAETTVDIRDPFDTLLMYVPRSAILAVSEELSVSGRQDLALPPGTAVQDPLVAHLGASLLPLIESPALASDLQLDHIAAALCVHLLRTYGATKAAANGGPSELTRRQLTRAKELLRAHLDGKVSLEDLARECGLSRSHFSRVFKQGTGQTPHGWLTEQRVAVSRDLLVESSLSLSEVARKCGFANQSHFTRVFARAEGVGPGAWRRSKRRVKLGLAEH